MSFFRTFNQHDRKSLVLNISLAAGAGLAIHAMAFALGWYEDNNFAVPWFTPPWWAVAAVWLALLALIATTRWMLNEYTVIGVVPARKMIAALIIVCLLWPVYSAASGSAMPGLIGTAATTVICLITAVFVWQRSHKSVLPLAPVVLWLAFTIVIFLEQMGGLQSP